VKKPILVITICISLILSACSSPAPTTTATPVPTDAIEKPTAILVPTDAPEPTEVLSTHTPEPTATLGPEPQPLSAANAANLAFQGMVELPRTSQLALP
jgi:hypothetical protein